MQNNSCSVPLCDKCVILVIFLLKVFKPDETFWELVQHVFSPNKPERCLEILPVSVGTHVKETFLLEEILFSAEDLRRG